jgi:hypothetical protein
MQTDMCCHRNNKNWLLRCVLWSALCFSPYGLADSKPKHDPHYTAAGFFDIHVCNWPDRPPFYLALLSTERFDEIAAVNITDAGGKPVGELDLKRYRTIARENKAEKRVFISHISLPTETTDGWFEASIMLRDGRRYHAADLVNHDLLGRVSGQTPQADSELATPPTRLSWNPLQGAGYYQVFIRDLWHDGKQIFASKLLPQSEIELPAGLLHPGGYYSWKVHARDIDGDIKLGDFNRGSQSEWLEFSVE